MLGSPPLDGGDVALEEDVLLRAGRVLACGSSGLRDGGGGRFGATGAGAKRFPSHDRPRRNQRDSAHHRQKIIDVGGQRASYRPCAAVAGALS